MEIILGGVNVIFKYFQEPEMHDTAAIVGCTMCVTVGLGANIILVSA